jgi:hypothetical protein
MRNVPPAMRRMSAHRRSEALNEAMGQAQKRAYEAEKGVERGLLDKVEAFTSSAELKAFCNEIWKSPLPDATRADVAARCQQKLQILAMADQQVDEARHAQASAHPDVILKIGGHSWTLIHAQDSQRETSALKKVRTHSRSIAIRCRPSSVRTSPPKTSLA